MQPASSKGEELASRFPPSWPPDLVVMEEPRDGVALYLYGQRARPRRGQLVCYDSPQVARATVHEGPQVLADRLGVWFETQQARGRVDLVASARHYLAHLVPIWRALPPERRGRFFCPVSLAGEAAARGLVVEGYRTLSLPAGGPVVVASYGDLVEARKSRRPVVYCEHGAGQTYGREHPSYANGADRRGVELILVPGPYAERAARRAQPAIPLKVVGCPWLDDKLPARPPQSPPVVAVSFHWNCGVAPETGETWSHWMPAIRGLTQHWKVIGHGHPAAWSFLGPRWRELGIDQVEHWEDVIEMADCYVVDNSSTAFEWSALDRPLVLLNAPWYRREKSFGLRFWDEAEAGLQVDFPTDLVAQVSRALEDLPEQRQRRRWAAIRVFGFLDGRAAERAARAICERF